MNPYIAAAVRHDEVVRRQTKPRSIPERGLPERVEAFFAAMEINHAGNRAKVLTGIAHTMKPDDLVEAITRLETDQKADGDLLASLDAPEVIVRNGYNKHKAALRILQRVWGG